MKLIKRTVTTESSTAEIVYYALHVGEDNYVHAWTPDRQIAQPVIPERAEAILVKYADRNVPGNRLEAVDVGKG